MTAPEPAIADAAELQRRYRARRLAWCRKIGIPIKGFELDIEPAVIDGDDPEEG